jgi:hypothetical protein
VLLDAFFGISCLAEMGAALSARAILKLARRITEQRRMVEAAITNKLSNAAVEQANSPRWVVAEPASGDEPDLGA